MFDQTVAYFVKGANIISTKPQLNLRGGLAKRGLTSALKWRDNWHSVVKWMNPKSQAIRPVFDIINPVEANVMPSRIQGYNNPYIPNTNVTWIRISEKNKNIKLV